MSENDRLLPPLSLTPSVLAVTEREMDFQTTHKHMSNLVRDYGAPIVAFSLIKKFEDQPKETILGAQFHYCIGTLRETPEFDTDLLQYVTFDFLKVRLAPFCRLSACYYQCFEFLVASEAKR